MGGAAGTRPLGFSACLVLLVWLSSTLRLVLGWGMEMVQRLNASVTASRCHSQMPLPVPLPPQLPSWGRLVWPWALASSPPTPIQISLSKACRTCTLQVLPLACRPHPAPCTHPVPSIFHLRFHIHPGPSPLAREHSIEPMQIRWPTVSPGSGLRCCSELLHCFSAAGSPLCLSVSVSVSR